MMKNDHCYSAFIVSQDKDNNKIHLEIVASTLSKAEKEAKEYLKEHPEATYFIEETTDKYIGFDEPEFEEEGEEDD